jgi:ParB family chromosome partitioning protein
MAIKDPIRRNIDIAKIDASDRLRATRQDWVDTFAESIQAGEQLPAIEVVERDGKYRLITGAHRLKAHIQVGHSVILADVLDAAAYADEAACRLREIKENMARAGLTELDRAVAIATWKEIYEATQDVQKRGGDRRSDQIAESAKWFSERFSIASSKALGISERSVFVAVSIATGIARKVRDRIATHPVADHQAELIALSRETPDRQAKIADLMLADPPAARNVAEAIAAIDKVPAPATAAPWEKISSKFSRLKEVQQHAFFDAHEAAIAAWLAKRGGLGGIIQPVTR